MKNRMLRERLIKRRKTNRGLLGRVNNILNEQAARGAISFSRRWDWWNDKEFMTVMDAEYEAIERGEAKAYTVEEAMQHLREVRKEFYAKMSGERNF